MSGIPPIQRIHIYQILVLVQEYVNSHPAEVVYGEGISTNVPLMEQIYSLLHDLPDLIEKPT